MRKTSLLLLTGIMLGVAMLSCSRAEQADFLTRAIQAGTTIAKVATEAPPALTEAAILAQTAKAGGEKLATRAAPYQKTLVAMATKQAIPVFNLDSDLTQRINLSGSALDSAIETIRQDSPMVGLGEAIVRIGEEKGINAYFITALTAHESNWGASPLAMAKNNLLAFGAYADCPFECAWTFNTKEGGIEMVMSQIKTDYLTEGGRYYIAPSLSGMNVYYAIDPEWKNDILKIMNALAAMVHSG